MRRALLVASRRGWEALGSRRLADLLSDDGPVLLTRTVVRHFEATSHEVSDVCARARETGASTIIGLGGGRAIDVAKASAAAVGARLIAVPTTCSTCTAASSWCTIDDHAVPLGMRPDRVLWDYRVLTAAPPHFLVNGMCEGAAVLASFNCARRRSALPGRGGVRRSDAQDAQRIERLVSAEGRRALAAAQHSRATPVFRHAVHTLIVSTAHLFEAVGMGPAHALFMALRADPSLRSRVQRQWLGFCSVFEMIALDSGALQLATHVSFLRSLGVRLNIGVHRLNARHQKDLVRLAAHLITNLHLRPPAGAMLAAFRTAARYAASSS